MADQTDADIQAIKPKGGILPVLVGINIVAVIAVLAVVLLRNPSGSTAKAGEEATAEGGNPAAAKVGPTVRLADFTARLHGADSDRYARLSIEIEVPTEKERDEFNMYMPQVRDGFISFFADSTLDDLTGSAALARTKQKLTDRLHQIVPTQKVRALYITDLVIQ